MGVARCDQAHSLVRRPARALRAAVVAAVVAAAALGPSLAAANGRSAATNGAATGTEPTRLLAQATFGLLLSRDDGDSWQWICEQSIGFQANYDPHVAFTADGALLATTVYGLSRSTDGGCTFVPATGLPDDLKSSVVAAHATDAGVVLASVISAPDQAGQLFRSSDGGQSFSPVELPAGTPALAGLAFAPADPDRAVVVTTSTELTRILVSDDAGATFTVGAEVARGSLRLVGQSPFVDGRLFLGQDDALEPALLSLDLPAQSGGPTVEPTLLTDTPGKINGFVQTGGALLVATINGLLRSTDEGATWTTETHPKSTCLVPAGEGGLTCGLNYTDMYALGRVGDEPGVTPLLDFRTNITGPVDCPVGTPTRDSCGALWTNLACQLGNPACPNSGADGGLPGDGGALDGGAGEDRGGGGSGCASAGPWQPAGPSPLDPVTPAIPGAVLVLLALLLGARRGRLGKVTSGLVLAATLAGCGESGPRPDATSAVDAANDPGCPALVSALDSEVMNLQHQTCSVDRECVIVEVNCCLDPHGQLVVTRDSSAEVTRIATQYDNLCPEPCECDTSVPGIPGCARGLQLCGYN